MPVLRKNNLGVWDCTHKEYITCYHCGKPTDGIGTHWTFRVTVGNGEYDESGGGSREFNFCQECYQNHKEEYQAKIWNHMFFQTVRMLSLS